jgi:hypothetical protein
MNGATQDMAAEVGSPAEDSGRQRLAARVRQPFVLPLWEGWAGFGGKNSVCAEARLDLPEICSSAGILPCPFEEQSFPVTIEFGRGFGE